MYETNGGPESSTNYLRSTHYGDTRLLLADFNNFLTFFFHSRVYHAKYVRTYFVACSVNNYKNKF